MRSLLDTRNVLTRSISFLYYAQRRNATLGTNPVIQKRKSDDSSIEQSVDNLERLKFLLENKVLNYDIGSIRLELLDLHVPVPVFTKGTTLQQIWGALQHNTTNKISNIVSMYRIAGSHSFPWNPHASRFSPQIFRATSTKPKTWLEPLRDAAFDSYKQLNVALACNNVTTIQKLTAGTYKKRILERAKILHRNTRSRKIWQLHSLASPVQCVSIRSQQGHFGKTDPLFGTRWFIQACIKFDTWQSLSVPSSSKLLTPEPKRVLEYLVFEKKMWYDEPWVVRDQLWPVIYR